MAFSFAPAAGSLIKVCLPGKTSCAPFFYINGLSQPGVVDVDDIQLGKNCIAGFMETIGGKLGAWHFGDGFTDCSIFVTVYLNSCEGSGEGRVENWFQSNKFCAGGSPVHVSVGQANGGASIFPVKMKNSGTDPEKGAIKYTILGKGL